MGPAMAQQPGQLDLRRQLTGLLKKKSHYSTLFYGLDIANLTHRLAVVESPPLFLVSTSELHLEALVPLTVKSR